MPGHAGSRERSSQAVAAQRRDFVQGKVRAGFGRPDCEHTGTGRGFEHEFVGDQRASPGSEPSKARRRCELLPFDLLVAAIGLGRNSVIEGEEELFRLVDRARELDLIERLQVLNLCQLQSCVGVTHRQTPESIAALEVVRHNAVDVATRKRAACCKL